MEYVYRTHKEVPFGWLLSLQSALTPRAKPERLRPAPRGRASGGLA